MTTVEPSSSKIHVGRDFKIGDVSGQMAIGQNITQTVYKDCTFVLPDGSTVLGKSWLYTKGIRPATDPANIFGRQQELEKINEFFKQSSSVAITGLRGTGKSTLASMYIDILEKGSEFAGIYWRRVDDTIDISDVVGSFFTVIGKPIKDLGNYKPAEQLNLLFSELNAAPYFLVLDNFEILLDSQTNKPLKPGFSDLIEKANESSARSRVLFTSWECPASERGIRPKCYPIGGLDETAATKLLRRSGLTEADYELKKVVELCGGHPLALILLVQLVQEGETLSSILNDNTLWIGEKGEVAENILDKVYKERLNDEERKLLQYVSLYREPVPPKAIVVVANDPLWNESAVKRIALSLIRKSLLQKTEENYWEQSLIHSYAYNKLVDKVERHKFARQYYLSFPLPEKGAKKEDVQHLIEAHYHACMAKEYDKAAGIIFDYNLDRDLFIWGNYRTLLDLYIGVLPRDHFRDKPLLNDINIYSTVLGELGRSYHALGEVKRAIEYHESALKIAQEIGDRKIEGRQFGYLGHAYHDLGEVKRAIEHLEKALKIAQEVGDRRNEGLWFGNLGNAYKVLGDVRKAIEFYEKALKIAQEIRDRKYESAWLGNIGGAYYFLGEFKRPIEYLEKALKIAQEIGDRKYEGLWFGNLSIAYSRLGDVRKTTEYLEKALKIAQEIGDRLFESDWLRRYGNIYHDLGEIKKAIEYLEKALKIAQEIGYREGEDISLRNLGDVYRGLGEVRKAIEYYEKALKIAQEIGDKVGENAALGSLGNVHRDLGEVRKAIEFYGEALKVAQEIGDRRNENIWLNNLGLIFHYEKKYKEALACYLLAKDIRTHVEDPHLKEDQYLKTTESNLKNLKERFGEKEFEKLVAAVAPRAEEIVKKNIEVTSG